jgi:hypothetical protein
MKKTLEKKLSSYMFPVQERAVFVEDDIGLNYKPTKKYEAIVREDDNTLISIMPKTYKLVPNRDVIMPLLEQLHKLDTNWLIDPSHSFVEDNRMRLQVTFPDLKLNDGRSDIALSLFLHNSYDGSEGVRMFFGGIRSICTNGMVFGTLLSKFYGKHTSGLDISNLKDQLEATYDKIPVIKHRIEILQNTKVTTKFRRESEDVLGKKMLKYVGDQEKQNRKAANLWILFNLITYFISHYVEMRLRADYQLRTSRLFQL